MRTWGSVVFLSVVLVVAGCSSGDDADGDAASSASAGISDSETSLDNVTYHKDIKPILNASCAECHRAGGAGIFDMTNYESAKPWAMAMALAVESRDMPPWGAFETEECSPRFAWQNDHRLSDEEIATVRAWAEAGAPEGNPADGSDEVIMSRTSLPDFDFEGSAALPVTIDGNEDSFICIVIDPGLEEETWLQGVEFIRDNEDLVHHVVLYSDPTRASLDLMNDDGTYTCFGSANVPGQTTIAAWAPGVLPLDLPDNMATRVAPGTLFVMQMHYSPQ
ncbi:MAG: hypothetical protein VX834_00440, partial [Myxococcota bacterium]|nr:hypothetical protein [Myxococcota bacterium]